MAEVRPAGGGRGPAKYGTAYIQGPWARLPGDPPFSGHWEAEEPTPHLVEEGPGWEDPEEAIAWGRERAPLVLVLLGPREDSVYSAGERQATRELPEYGGTDLTPYPDWPPSERPTD